METISDITMNKLFSIVFFHRVCFFNFISFQTKYDLGSSRKFHSIRCSLWSECITHISSLNNQLSLELMLEATPPPNALPLNLPPPPNQETMSGRVLIERTTPRFLHFPTRARIFKLLRSPGIDSKESIPPAYVAWRNWLLWMDS